MQTRHSNSIAFLRHTAHPMNDSPGRRIMTDTRDSENRRSFLRRSSVGFLDSATQVGVRETRAIVGEYELTPQDVLEPRGFPDTIAQGGHPVDIHLPGDSGQDVQFVRKAYDIPYRCLVPKLRGAGTYWSAAEASRRAKRPSPQHASRHSAWPSERPRARRQRCAARKASLSGIWTVQGCSRH